MGEVVSWHTLEAAVAVAVAGSPRVMLGRDGEV